MWLIPGYGQLSTWAHLRWEQKNHSKHNQSSRARNMGWYHWNYDIHGFAITGRPTGYLLGTHEWDSLVVCHKYLASLPLGWLGCCTVRFPWEQRRVCLAVTEIANFSLLKARWACFAFHWYDYLAKVFVPSMGLEDVIAHTEGLTMCAISDSQQSLSLSNTEMSLMRKAVFQTEWSWMLLQSPKEAPVPLFKQNVVSLYLMRWLVYCLY